MCSEDQPVFTVTEADIAAVEVSGKGSWIRVGSRYAVPAAYSAQGWRDKAADNLRLAAEHEALARIIEKRHGEN